jgi:hypothetical protein
MMYSKRERDRLWREITDSLSEVQIVSAAGFMMRRPRTDLPDDDAPLKLGIEDVKEFIERLDVRGLRELLRVAKGLEYFT